MSDLPDLNTGSIGYIAYWNAIDNSTEDSISPSEVTSDGNINSYTLYDNGVQIDDYSLINGRSAKARVKNDGWIMAYIDRTNNFQPRTSLSNVRGYVDICNDWTDADNTPSSITNNTLERAVNSLASNLSNWGSISTGYTDSDVALYNYEYSSATATTLLGYQRRGYDYGGGSTTVDFTIGAGTDAKFGVCGGRGYADYDCHGEVIIESNTVVDETDSSSYGARSLSALGLLTDGTTYSTEIEGNSNSGNREGKAVGTVILIWE